MIGEAQGAHREGKLVEDMAGGSIQGPVYISYPVLLFSVVFSPYDFLVFFKPSISVLNTPSRHLLHC